MSVRLEELGSHRTDFREIWNLNIFFWKFLQRIQFSLKSDKINRHFAWRPINIYDRSYLAHFLWEWKMFQTKFVEKINPPHFLFVNKVFRKSCRLWNNLEKYSRAGQAVHGNAATNSPPEYVKRIALPLKQRLYQRPSVSCSTYIACLVHIRWHNTYLYLSI